MNKAEMAMGFVKLTPITDLTVEQLQNLIKFNVEQAIKPLQEKLDKQDELLNKIIRNGSALNDWR